jgi:hypothetical protein
MLKMASDLQVEFTQFWIKKQCPKISNFITGSGCDIIWIFATSIALCLYTEKASIMFLRLYILQEDSSKLYLLIPF